VGINSGGVAPDVSALLDLNSTSKGFLLPRMTDFQQKSIKYPATGLMVFNTDSLDLYVFTGYYWVSVLKYENRDTIYPWVCGNTIPVSHIAGDIAPVSQNVSYGTVTNIPGETSKCWITSNLGAEHQAISQSDATEASAGWYWQFNRMRGYKHDGTSVAPAWTISGIDENSEWLAANDPCAIELGGEWRLPTSSEWTNVDASGDWLNWNGPWNSSLKLHAAGYLNTTNGSLILRGTVGYNWSSTQYNTSEGMRLYFHSTNCSSFHSFKAEGHSIRCLKTNWVCGEPIIKFHVQGAVAPVTKSVTYSTVTNIPGETSKCWITSNLGADHQATAVTDATEASAGWYWQFNRAQGYKYSGTTRTPNTAWTDNINENSDWIAANDPCSLELGISWRLPTYTEWNNVTTSGSWTNWNGPWNSALKIHAAGDLLYLDGTLYNRGAFAFYWSSTHAQWDDQEGWHFAFDNASCYMATNTKSYGFSSRCIHD
jgi:hypothetical protein